MLVIIGSLLVAMVVLLYAYDWSYRLVYAFRARARNCAPPSPMSKYDCLPLGITNSFRVARAYNDANALEFIRNQFGLMGRSTNISWVAGNWGLFTCNQEIIKATLATSFKDFNLGQRYSIFFPLLGNGIFTLSGEGWKHSRALLRPQFTREQISHIESITHHVDLMIDSLLRESVEGRRPDAQAHFFSLTLDTATEFLFGTSADTLLNSDKKAHGPTRNVSGPEFGRAFANAQTMLGYRFMAGGLYSLIDSIAFRRNIDICKNYIDSYVYRALDDPMEKYDVSDKFVFIRELTKETRDPVVIRDQALNILLAGRDTTAATMSFMTCYLAHDKSVWKRLRREVLNHFGENSSSITFESLKRCKYLSNVINEVLRLNPIVPVNFRFATKDTVLPTGGGPNEDKPIFIPKGGVVLYSVYAMHRSVKNWGPDAMKFNPDRWEDTSAHSHQWDFLPFNGGPRICLGQQFALTEMACTWVRICQRIEDIDVFVDGDPATMKQLLTVTTSVAGGVPSKWTSV